MCEQNNNQTQNTDRELWREDVTDRPADKLFVTESGGIGMSCGGAVIVMPIRKWHMMACQRTLSESASGRARYQLTGQE